MLRVGLILCLFSIQAFGLERDLKRAGSYAREGRFEKAVKRIERLKDEKLAPNDLHTKYFVLGEWHAKLENWSVAKDYLLKALELKTPHQAHANYMLGYAAKMLGDYPLAKKHLNKAKSLKPARSLTYLTRFELGEIAFIQKHYKTSYKHYKYLERRWRGTQKHAEVVWRLIGVELKRKRKWRACRWARKMYARYPYREHTTEWGIDLQNNQYEGKALGCFASTKDVKKRVKKLQLAGQASRAREEIEVLRSRATKVTQYEVDMILVEFLRFQGFSNEALTLLIKHHPQKKAHFDYQILLAKVASKAGEFPTAVGAYKEANKLRPWGKKGRKALFSAAFLSYQFQDYDGATRKFQEFAKKYRRSGLARDAKWHLAWLRYLRRDFVGASKDFRKLMNVRTWRRRRVYRPFRNDRTRYWLAMSELKQEKYAEAGELLLELSSRKNWSYYSVLARERMEELGDKVQLRAPASKVPLALPESPDDVAVLDASPDEEKESEESITENETEDTDPIDDKNEEEDEEIAITEFQNPNLQKRFERAQLFQQLGLMDWAKWELFEIERRTRNKDYLTKLMKAYKEMGFYHRAMYISEVHFSSKRHKQGFRGARLEWEMNFPQAYKDLVESVAGRFDVEDEVMWAIMRAESKFRKEAVSPVGARGLMQVMPYTAEKVSRILMGERVFNVKSFAHPEVNVRYGGRYLARLNKKFSELLPLVAAGYNAGPHRVKGWLNSFGNLPMDEFIEHIPFVETRNYVKKVTRNYVVYKNLYSDATKGTLKWLISSIPVRVPERPTMRENWEKLD